MQHTIRNERLRPLTSASWLTGWLASICLLLGAFGAQAQVATIGATAVPPVSPATSSYFYGPLYRSSATSTFFYSRYAALYTATELSAAGITPGVTITEMAWLKADAGTISGANNFFEVRLANSSLTSLTTGTTWGSLKTGTNVAYTSSTQDVTGAAGSYFAVPTTGFTYTGGSLLVLTDWTLSGSSTGAVNFVTNPAAGQAIGNASGTVLTDASTLTAVSYGDRRPTLRITAVPTTPCTAPPTAGSAVASTTSGCGTVNVGLSLTGSTFGSGLTYQWQQSTTGPTGTFTNIAGATNFGYSATVLTTTTFRAVLTCSGQSATSTPVTVTVLAQPTYATLPYTENFESWVSRCGTSDVPSINWQNGVPTGDNSWRREDQGTTANWTTTNGLYSPAFTTGAHSARFHTYDVSSGTSGTLDLYANAVGTGTLTLTFDYINTSGTDRLEVLLSNDGGVTFGSVVATQGVSATWSSVLISLPAGTATSVVRLQATSDYGVTDIGVDNLRLALVTCPAVTAVTTSAVTTTSANVAFTGTPGAGTYTVTYTPTGGTAQTATGSASPIALTGLTPGTAYTVSVVANCGGTNGNSLGATATFATLLSGGVYTINNLQPTGGTNFTSFSDAAAVLNGGGVTGGVTFNVLNGPYTEQLMLNNVTGASATNRLVFNGNGRTIQFGSNDSNQRAVIMLNGTDYVTIDSLNVDATVGGTSTSTYGWGILLTNSADNNIIRGNTVTSDVSSTSTNFAGIVSSGSTSGATTSGTNTNQNVTIERNTVNGGYYGITAVGNSTASPSPGTIIRNNQVRNFYIYGVYSLYQDGLQLIGNDMARPTRTAVTTFYGIYLSTGTRGARVERNRIHQAFSAAATSTSGAYGIYLTTGTAATAAQPNSIINNLVYNLDGNGTVYGIYNGSSSNSRYYFNTINLDDQTNTSTSATYGFYHTTGTGVEFRNNIVRITRAGTGLKYALYFSSATGGGIISNYNDLVGSGTGFNTGYYLAAFATLANWQAANGGAYDANSIAADPQYVSLTNGNLQPTNVALNNAGTAIAGITTDFTGATRGTTPDIGAYEFTPVSIDVSPVSLLSPGAMGGCYGPAAPVIVQIRNSGTASLNLATSPVTVTVVVTLPGGTTQTFTSTVNTGTLASNATLNVTLPGTLNMSTLGNYSFVVTTTAMGDLNTANDVLTPAPTRAVLAPVAGTLSPASSSVCASTPPTLTLTGSANGNIQYQTSSSATGPFTDVAGATSAAYTPAVLSVNTFFRAKISCNGTDVFSNVASISVTNPQLLTAPAATTCAGGTAQLLATAPTGATVRYYTAATGGTPLTSSLPTGPFTTPALTTTTTYYAAAVVGSQENVGKPSTNGADGTNTIGGLYFTATGQTSITNVTVYRSANAAAGTATIQLLSGSTTTGTPLSTTTVPVPANTSATVSPTVLTLNFNVPAAGQYTLYLSAATPSLIRDYSASMPANAFPYTSPSGVITITDGTLANYYYFFYNWQIGSECAGARTPITVTVTPGLVATLPAATASLCGATPYALNGSIAGTATGIQYTSTGTGTFTPNATTLNATYTPSAADITAGTVTITATPTGPAAPCTSPATVVLTLQPAPQATFSFPSTTVYCLGTAGATAVPVLAAGTQAGTFTASSPGVRIDPVTGAINLATTVQPGTYTITNTVAGTGACSSGVTATATITLNFGAPQPTLQATPQANGTVVLTTVPVPNLTYQYYRNGVAVGTPTATGTLTLTGNNQSGNYTVVAITSAGCQSAPSTGVVATVTGTRNTAGGLSLQVVPNPTADGHLAVRLSGATKTSPLVVLNALGQVVQTGTVGATSAEVDLSGVASGVYVLRVTTPQGVLTERIVRQ